MSLMYPSTSHVLTERLLMAACHASYSDLELHLLRAYFKALETADASLLPAAKEKAAAGACLDSQVSL